MHYLYAIITFIVGFVLFIISHVFFGYEVGGFYSFFSFSAVLGLVVLVFMKTRKKTTKAPKVPNRHILTKYELKDFRKVFSPALLEELEIKSAHVKREAGDTFDYIVLLETDHFSSLNLDTIRKKMRKRFYDVDRINLSEFSNQNGSNYYTIQAK